MPVSAASAGSGLATSLVRSFDLARLSQAFLDDPYPTYRALREHAPVQKLPDGSFFLTGYDDLVRVYRDTVTWSSDKKVDFRPNFGNSLLYEHHTTSLVFNDPPIHTRVRKLLAPAFTPRALRALEPRIEMLVDRLLDGAARCGTVDLIDEFAAAIPLQLIGDLLGIPQEERGPLRKWSLIILGALEPVLTREQFESGVRAVAEFKAYLANLIARRKDHTGTDGREILSTLINGSEFASTSLADGERLSELELIHNCIFLLNAGHETTTNLIGNGVDLLLRHPDAKEELANHPDLIDLAIEEFLRMESSNQLGNRRAAVDTTLNDVAIPAKSYVHLCIGAANRDPAQFPDPDRLDIRRSPNRHLAFGLGIHACAGMSLARMEARIAIGKLVSRFQTIQRAGDPARGGRARFRGFLHLPVAVL
ncbi:MAG TPA: cytochrome P450 [Xanthobacteraceae bacterium]